MADDRPDHLFVTSVVAHAHDIGGRACEYPGCLAPWRAHPTRTAEMRLPGNVVVPPGPLEYKENLGSDGT